MVHSIMLQLFGNEYKLFFFCLLLLPTRINKYDTHLSSSIVNSKAQILTLQLSFTAICTVYYSDFLFVLLCKIGHTNTVTLWNGLDALGLKLGKNTVIASWHRKINQKVIFHCTDTSKLVWHELSC